LKDGGWVVVKTEAEQNRVKKAVAFLDSCPLFLVGLIFFLGLFIIYFSWGDDTVFDIHDQLDETICSYVLPARHLFGSKAGYPEMMTTLPSESLKSSAPIFVILYHFCSVPIAFLIQFLIETLSAFLGMYFLTKRITKSSLAALPVAVLFSLLPFQPVYGLNVMGLPILVLSFLTLYEVSTIPEEKKRLPGAFLSIVGIVFYTICTHIALAGYVACFAVFAAMIVILIRDKGKIKIHGYVYIGGAVLLSCYVLYNIGILHSLIIGGTGFVSHRTEFAPVISDSGFFRQLYVLFLYGEENYAASIHRFLIPVLLILTVYFAIRYRKLEEKLQNAFKLSVVFWGAIVICCILSALFGCKAVTTLLASSKGFLRHVELSRFYYFLPGLWWGLTGILFGMFVKDKVKLPTIVRVLILIAALLPTVWLMKTRLNYYDNINYQNHGSAYTGKKSMAEYYHEDVLAQIDAYIGEDKSTYRIAHVGLSPAPALVYGFYTVDGYSNNYPLEYKHAFRKVIAPALEENEVLKTYFDGWGSRAYLFLDESHITEDGYENLPYDFEALADLGCEYILSDKKISGTKELVLEKAFVDRKCGDKIWLYYLETEETKE
jgi:hypothetical protein